MSKPIKPSRLQSGDTIGIISPSSLIPEEYLRQFKIGVKVLESWGLKVKLGEHVFDKYYYSAGKRTDRISDFNTLWKDPDVKMILMSLGGSTSVQLLDGLDYKLISSHPKIFAGISDGTTLLNAIYAKTNLVTYHGPDVIFTFGTKMSQLFKENITKTFFQGEVGKLQPNPDWSYQENKSVHYQGWRWLREGEASGRLVGGHSNCLSHLILSGYGPDFSEKILFLEGTDSLGQLDRQLSSFRLKGIFDQICGLIIGWFEGYKLEEDLNRPVSDVILELTSDYDFPILEIGELGHNVENYVLPIGCKATINSSENLFSIDERTVI